MKRVRAPFAYPKKIRSPTYNDVHGLFDHFVVQLDGLVVGERFYPEEFEARFEVAVGKEWDAVAEDEGLDVYIHLIDQVFFKKCAIEDPAAGDEGFFISFFL